MTVRYQRRVVRSLWTLSVTFDGGGLGLLQPRHEAAHGEPWVERVLGLEAGGGLNIPCEAGLWGLAMPPLVPRKRSGWSITKTPNASNSDWGSWCSEGHLMVGARAGVNWRRFWCAGNPGRGFASSSFNAHQPPPRLLFDVYIMRLADENFKYFLITKEANGWEGGEALPSEERTGARTIKAPLVSCIPPYLPQLSYELNIQSYRGNVSWIECKDEYWTRTSGKGGTLQWNMKLLQLVNLVMQLKVLNLVNLKKLNCLLSLRQPPSMGLFPYQQNIIENDDDSWLLANISCVQFVWLIDGLSKLFVRFEELCVPVGAGYQ